MRTPFVIIQTSTCPFSNCRSWPSNTKQALISFSFGRNDIFVLKNHYWTAYMSLKYKGFPGGSVVKKSPASAGDLGLTPGSGRLPWRREWQPTPVFLPGKSHGQRSLGIVSHRKLYSVLCNDLYGKRIFKKSGYKIRLEQLQAQPQHTHWRKLDMTTVPMRNTNAYSSTGAY